MATAFCDVPISDENPSYVSDGDSCLIAVAHDCFGSIGAGGKALRSNARYLTFGFYAASDDRPAFLSISSARRSLEDTPGGAGEERVRLFAARKMWSASLLDMPMPFPGDYHLPIELREIVGAIENASGHGKSREFYLSCKFGELLVETLRKIAANALIPTCGSIALGMEDSARILKADEIVQEHWSQSLKIEEIARRCGVNRSKLTSGYRALFGRSIGQAMAELKFDEAKRLLKFSERTVTLISYDVGYENSAAFTRAFRNHVGISPQEYRQSHVIPLSTAPTLTEAIGRSQR